MTDRGDRIRFGNPSQDAASAPFRDLAGTAANPTTVTLRVLRPDGTTLVYGWPAAGADGTLANEATGRFYAEVTVDQSGLWRFRLESTGTVIAAAEGTLRVDRRRVP